MGGRRGGHGRRRLRLESAAPASDRRRPTSLAAARAAHLAHPSAPRRRAFAARPARASTTHRSRRSPLRRRLPGRPWQWLAALRSRPRSRPPGGGSASPRSSCPAQRPTGARPSRLPSPFRSGRPARSRSPPPSRRPARSPWRLPFRRRELPGRLRPPARRPATERPNRPVERRPTRCPSWSASRAFGRDGRAALASGPGAARPAGRAVRPAGPSGQPPVPSGQPPAPPGPPAASSGQPAALSASPRVLQPAPGADLGAARPVPSDRWSTPPLLAPPAPAPLVAPDPPPRGMGYNPTYATGAAGPAQRAALLERDMPQIWPAWASTWSSAGQPTVFDDQLLAAAQANDVSVIMPFDLAPDRDYADPDVRLAIMRDVAAWVVRYRDQPAIVMWGVGNEVTLGMDDDQRRAFAEFYVDLFELVRARPDPPGGPARGRGRLRALHGRCLRAPLRGFCPPQATPTPEAPPSDASAALPASAPAAPPERPTAPAPPLAYQPRPAAAPPASAPPPAPAPAGAAPSLASEPPPPVPPASVCRRPSRRRPSRQHPRHRRPSPLRRPTPPHPPRHPPTFLPMPRPPQPNPRSPRPRLPPRDRSSSPRRARLRRQLLHRPDRPALDRLGRQTRLDAPLLISEYAPAGMSAPATGGFAHMHLRVAAAGRAWSGRRPTPGRPPGRRRSTPTSAWSTPTGARRRDRGRGRAHVRAGPADLDARGHDRPGGRQRVRSAAPARRGAAGRGPPDRDREHRRHGRRRGAHGRGERRARRRGRRRGARRPADPRGRPSDRLGERALRDAGAGWAAALPPACARRCRSSRALPAGPATSRAPSTRPGTSRPPSCAATWPRWQAEPDGGVVSPPPEWRSHGHASRPIEVELEQPRRSASSSRRWTSNTYSKPEP